MPDGNKSSASRLSLSAMLPQTTCSQPSRRGLQQASSARHSAVGVPGMDALGGRMDTLLQVVNARPDAQSRCRRAARSRAELVVVWCTCREQKGMPEYTVSESLRWQLSAWAHQLLRTCAGATTRHVLFRARGGARGQGLSTLRAGILPCVRPPGSSASLPSKLLW